MTAREVTIQIEGCKKAVKKHRFLLRSFVPVVFIASYWYTYVPANANKARSLARTTNNGTRTAACNPPTYQPGTYQPGTDVRDPPHPPPSPFAAAGLRADV